MKHRIVKMTEGRTVSYRAAFDRVARAKCVRSLVEIIRATRVVVQPGAKNSPHRHATSEQIWVALNDA